MLTITAEGPGNHPFWTHRRLQSAARSPDWSADVPPSAGMHGIHAYPARFPAEIVRQAFAQARRDGTHVRRVADPFCGSGTVAHEAALQGIAFWGCDVNPVATLIAKAKGLRLDPVAFRSQAERILLAFEGASSAPPLSRVAVDRLLPWYAPEQFRHLSKLRNAIASEVDGEEAIAFDCAFSAILKATSLWRARSVKPSRDGAKRAVPVVEAFQRQCLSMARAFADVASCPPPEATIVRGDILRVGAPATLVDLIVTSPPYATTYDYADLHQLSTVWLGLADDHRQLRPSTIGSCARRASFGPAARDLNTVGIQVVFALFERHRPMAEAVAAYYLDMQRAAVRCHRFLRPGGMATFVIGNTRCRGVEIDNANHLVESLLDAGFSGVRVERRQIGKKANTPYRLANGRLSTASDGLRLYAEEYVLMASKR